MKYKIEFQLESKTNIENELYHFGINNTLPLITVWSIPITAVKRNIQKHFSSSHMPKITFILVGDNLAINVITLHLLLKKIILSSILIILKGLTSLKWIRTILGYLHNSTFKKEIYSRRFNCRCQILQMD